MMRWLRRAAYTLAAVDLAVALVWRSWCRSQGYAEQAAEIELKAWP